MKAGGTARDYVEALYGFMEELKLETALTERMHPQAEAGRMQEAEETAQLWEILCGVLDQFVEILGEEHLEQSEFERLFRLVLTQYSVGTIPVALDQVSVSEITRNDRHTTSYLFLLGANDHVLPDPGQSGGLLNEDDRQALALRGVELAPTGMERMGIELQNLYAALAQPTAGLTVSYPVTDVSGSELRPRLWWSGCGNCSRSCVWNTSELTRHIACQPLNLRWKWRDRTPTAPCGDIFSRSRTGPAFKRHGAGAAADGAVCLPPQSGPFTESGSL